MPVKSLSKNTDDVEALRKAVDILENPRLTAQITHQIGRPIEAIIGSLPKSWSNRVVAVSEKTMTHALEFAVQTMDVERKPSKARRGAHTFAAITSGAVGGAAGFAGLAAELPVSTTLMLRSIADIAHSEGEDLSEVENRMHCLLVFALGGPSVGDDAVETGYFAVRYALARAVSEAAKHVSMYGVSGHAAPGIVHLIRMISTRFGVALSQKAAAQMVPLLGAIGGAGVNYAFMEHFQHMATGHFTVRRLERAYGEEAVRKLYDEIKLELV